MLFAEVVNTVVKEENFSACLISWKSLESFARKILRLSTRINTQKIVTIVWSWAETYCEYDFDIVMKHNPKFRLSKNLQIPNYRITDKWTFHKGSTHWHIALPAKFGFKPKFFWKVRRLSWCFPHSFAVSLKLGWDAKIKKLEYVTSISDFLFFKLFSGLASVKFMFFKIICSILKQFALYRAIL